jgi:hypothetical protein
MLRRRRQCTPARPRSPRRTCLSHGGSGGPPGAGRGGAWGPSPLTTALRRGPGSAPPAPWRPRSNSARCRDRSPPGASAGDPERPSTSTPGRRRGPGPAPAECTAATREPGRHVGEEDRHAVGGADAHPVAGGSGPGPSARGSPRDSLHHRGAMPCSARIRSATSELGSTGHPGPVLPDVLPCPAGWTEIRSDRHRRSPRCRSVKP